jgi:hypothetical protein
VVMASGGFRRATSFPPLGRLVVRGLSAFSSPIFFLLCILVASLMFGSHCVGCRHLVVCIVSMASEKNLGLVFGALLQPTTLTSMDFIPPRIILIINIVVCS